SPKAARAGRADIAAQIQRRLDFSNAIKPLCPMSGIIAPPQSGYIAGANHGDGTDARAPPHTGCGRYGPAGEVLVFKAQRVSLKPIRAMLVASLVVPAGVLALFAWHSHKQEIRQSQDRAH